MDVSARAWLIRHGESTANAGSATADPARIPLTPRGHAQAAHVAAALPRPPVLIVTSGYLRTEETARPTLERFPGVAHEQWPVHEFTYLAGLHGRPSTAAERAPLVSEYWRRADPHHIDGPGAESFAGLLGRAADLLRRLERCPPGPVAVFTHGYFIRAVLWALATGPAAPTADSMRLFRAVARSLDLANAAVFPLTLDAGGAGRLRLGGLGHLPEALITSEPPVTHP